VKLASTVTYFSACHSRLKLIVSRQHTSPAEKAFDSVLDVYEQLGVHMPQLSKYEKLLQTFPGSEECLVNIYDDVQRFHTLAYKLFSLRAKCEITPGFESRFRR
jgi:hypothetical protein